MAAVQSSATSAGTVAGTAVVAKPSGLTEGDLMIGMAMVYNTYTITSPGDSWTEIAPVNSVIRTRSFYKIADAADVAASDFTFTFSGSDQVVFAGILRVTDFDSVTPIQATVAGDIGDSVVLVNLPALTTDDAEDLVIILGFSQEANTWTLTTANAGTNVEQFDVSTGAGFDASIAATSVVLTSVGSTGVISGTRDNNGDQMAVHAFIINDAADVTTTSTSTSTSTSSTSSSTSTSTTTSSTSSSTTTAEGATSSTSSTSTSTSSTTSTTTSTSTSSTTTGSPFIIPELEIQPVTPILQMHGVG